MSRRRLSSSLSSITKSLSSRLLISSRSIGDGYESNVYKQTATPIETPTLIKDKLAEFELALDNVSDDEKSGYLLAKEEGHTECDDAHKLMFLRCEVFNVDKAVVRFVKYWNARVAVFGRDKAFLPLTSDGALKDDIESINVGYLQVADKTDPDGRAVLCFDFRKEGEDLSSDSLLRVIWYQVHLALRQESCQKQGVVIYVRCVDRYSHWRPSLTKKMSEAAKGILPIRFAGAHITHPPTFIRLILAVVKPIMGKKMRHRFYQHSGSVDDLLKSLQKFSLGKIDLLPTIFGGELTYS